MCLSNTNCLIVDSNCNSCDPIDETMCISCINNYLLYQGNCISNSNCLVTISNCTSCYHIDEKICLSCKKNYSLLNNICEYDSPCLSIHNCIECNKVKKDICEKCEKGTIIDQKNNQCIYCKENCKECYIDINEKNKCQKCSINFSIYNHECISNNCFSDFCLDCSIDFKIGCEICYECKNLLFISGLVLKCSE